MHGQRMVEWLEVRTAKRLWACFFFMLRLFFAFVLGLCHLAMLSVVLCFAWHCFSAVRGQTGLSSQAVAVPCRAACWRASCGGARMNIFRSEHFSVVLASSHRDLCLYSRLRCLRHLRLPVS